MNTGKNALPTLASLGMCYWRNRNLILQLTKREVIGRYRGSFLGMAWSLFNPMLMLAVYTFVFGVVFRARWGESTVENKANFALLLFVGMTVHGLFAECINRAPGLILSNVNYIKKIVFPVEILPCIAMCSALFHTLINLVVILATQLFFSDSLPWTAVLIPIIFAPLIFATLGIALFLSALGVYVRDIAQTTGLVTMALMFISPVFYPVSALPEEYRVWLYANPLTFIIESARQILISGITPDWQQLFIYFLFGVGLLWIGAAWFHKVKAGFADVI